MRMTGIGLQSPINLASAIPRLFVAGEKLCSM
jgi:hypothetical protein